MPRSCHPPPHGRAVRVSVLTPQVVCTNTLFKHQPRSRETPMTIHAVPSSRPAEPGAATESGEHRWVAAALVEVGRGSQSRRAEHAARTGRHVLPAATRIDVLEVYCAWCRVAYESHE